MPVPVRGACFKGQIVKGLAAAGLALTCAMGAGSVSASGDFFPPKYFSLSDGNTYTLAQPAYTGMSVPFLAPANDSRVNLMLLLADARHMRPHFLSSPTPFGRHGRYVAQTPIDFGTFTAVFDDGRPKPAPATENAYGVVDGQGDRCRSNAASAAAYVIALKASAAIASEKSLLVAARTALTSACFNGTAAASLNLAKDAITSAPGRDFTLYLAAASAFYSGDFSSARWLFVALGNSAQPWIREASLYGVARVDLNVDQAGIDGDYGGVSLQYVDTVALGQAETEYQTYLHDYPVGLYVGSASGLERRVLWLRGDKARLADLYEKAFDDETVAGNTSMLDLTYEIDDKLFTGAKVSDIRGPWLLAALDLTRMRTEDGKPALTQADLDAQAALFAAQPELYTYLRAAFSFYIENRPADVLKTLDGIKPAPHMSSVRYSELSLKGLALEALHRSAAARAHWLAIVPFTEPVLQRSAVELALAQNYEKSGDVAAVFAKGSPIHDPTYREILLSQSASPELLRARAIADDAPVHERQLALYVLLFKELTRGRYQAFTDDWRLMPDPAPPRTYGDKLQIGLNNPPALIDFTRFGNKAHDGYTCPAIATVTAGLAANPHDEANLICLGEFVRIYEYDGYGYSGYENVGFLRQDNPPSTSSTPTAPVELGSVATQFPGRAISRLDTYRDIIKDPKADADVRAFALYRAVKCWAPGGNNSCDESDVPLGQRQQWYHELKVRYPSSYWAKSLKFYW